MNILLDGKIVNNVNLEYYGDLVLPDVNVSTLPYDLTGGAAVVLNNELHILGGNNNNKRHYKWNGSSWASVSTLPYPFYYGSAVVLNGEIHILGSCASGNTTKHYKWNGSSWTSVSTLPYDFYGAAAVVLNDAIHIMGSNDLSHERKHYKYASGAWTSVSTFPSTVSNTAAATTYKNTIYVVRGTSDGYGLYKLVKSAWVLKYGNTRMFFGGSLLVHEGAIHMLGYDVKDTSDECAHEFTYGSVSTDVSIAERTLPATLSFDCAVVLNNKIHLLGGENNPKQHIILSGVVKDAYIIK